MISLPAIIKTHNVYSLTLLVNKL